MHWNPLLADKIVDRALRETELLRKVPFSDQFPLHHRTRVAEVCRGLEGCSIHMDLLLGEMFDFAESFRFLRFQTGLLSILRSTDAQSIRGFAFVGQL